MVQKKSRVKGFVNDKGTLLVVSGWFGSIFILPVFTDSNSFVLLIINLPSVILFLLAAIWLDKKGCRK